MWGKWHNLTGEKAKEWDRKCFDRIKAMGGTAVPGDFPWAMIEKEQGVYDWDFADHNVEAARERGLEVFAYTGLTPQWALPPEAPQDKDGIGYRFPPHEKYAKEFEQFHEMLARRYRGKVKYYQFWNEPNGCSWINDGCSNGHMAHTYVPWLKRWYTAMKKGDPDCVLAVGGLDYNAGVKEGYRYLEDIYKHGGGDYFDHVAIHPYGEPLHWKAVKDTYACLVRHGDGHKRLWLNEYGWNTRNEEKKAGNIQEVLARFKTQEYFMVFQANYLVLTDLNKDGHDYGMCDMNLGKLEIRPRESYTAFKNLDKSFPPDANIPPEATGVPAPPEPPPGPNLLRNPNFEEDFVRAPEEFQDDEDRVRLRAPDWELWGLNWWTRSGGDGHLNHTPFGAQSVATNWGRIRNAVYQRVRAKEGQTYQFSAWTRVDGPEEKGDWVWRRVGIDPTGGMNPLAKSVVWSTYLSKQETWQEQSVRAEAAGDAITVFAYGETIKPNGWQWFHVDTAELVVVDE
jgi:hypothetical protein